MFYPGWDEQHITCLKRVFFGSVLKNAMPGDDDINLVLRVGLLRIVANRLVYLDRHGAVPGEFEEGFTFVGV